MEILLDALPEELRLPFKEGVEDFRKVAGEVKERLGIEFETERKFTRSTNIHEHEGNGVTDFMMVPAHRAGAIIGHHGEGLRKIEGESQCKVYFDQGNRGGGGGDQQQLSRDGYPEKKIIIIGYEEDIQKAKALLNQRLNEAQKDGGGDGAGFSTEYISSDSPACPIKDSPHPILAYIVPNNRVGLMIGKGGETIKDLQERSSVRMSLLQAPSGAAGGGSRRAASLIPAKAFSSFKQDDGKLVTVPQGKGKILLLSGSPDAIPSVFTMIYSLIGETLLDRMDEDVDEFSGVGSGLEDDGSGSVDSKTFWIPDSSVGMVIGKRAETLRLIQSKAGNLKIIIGDESERSKQTVQFSSSSEGTVPLRLRRVDIDASGCRGAGPEHVKYIECAFQLICERVATCGGIPYEWAISQVHSGGGGGSNGNVNGLNTNTTVRDGFGVHEQNPLLPAGYTVETLTEYYTQYYLQQAIDQAPGGRMSEEEKGTALYYAAYYAQQAVEGILSGGKSQG